MDLGQATAQVLVPDRLAPGPALARTTHLGIGAHPDDLELMAWHAIGACHGRADRWFTGVIATDGARSPRSGSFAATGDAEMSSIRLAEQQRAAAIGDYAALVWLGYPSAAVVAAATPALVADLRAVLRATRPEVVYTHNPFDAHDTHVAVCLRVIEAARGLAEAERPQRLYGCEVWRGLDWLPGDDRVGLDASDAEELGMAQLAVYASQIAGGKRYDLAAAGRKRANATFSDPRRVDRARAVEYAIDLTRLVREPDLDVHALASEVVGRLAADVSARLRRLSP